MSSATHLGHNAAPHIRGKVVISKSRASRNTGAILWYVYDGGKKMKLAEGTEYEYQLAIDSCSLATAAMRAHWMFDINGKMDF